MTDITACDGIETYLEEGVTKTMLFFTINANNTRIGDVVYLTAGSYDCTYASNGWYFTDETANNNTAFRIENGVVVEYSNCSQYTTTTTTTTSAPMFTFSGVLELVNCASTSAVGIMLNNTSGNLGDVLTLKDTATLLDSGTYRLTNDVLNIFYSDITGIPYENAIIQVNSDGIITSKSLCS